jgi:hypothetical protein
MMACMWEASPLYKVRCPADAFQHRHELRVTAPIRSRAEFAQFAPCMCCSVCCGPACQLTTLALSCQAFCALPKWLTTFSAPQPDPERKTLAELKLEHPIWQLRTPSEAQQAWKELLQEVGQPVPKSG